MTESSREGDIGGTGKCSILEIQLQNCPGVLCCSRYDCTMVSLREIVTLDIVLDPIFHFIWIYIQVYPLQILYDYPIKSKSLTSEPYILPFFFVYVLYMYFMFM